MLSKSRVKYIQSLSQKKFRRSAEVFLVEGPKCVEEMMAEAPQAIEAVYALREWCEAHPSTPALEEITPEELAKISQLTTPNQLLALVRKPRPAVAFDPRNKISLFLETIQDPGNMGTIIRLADWFGITQVAATPDSVDFFHPKVVQSTMGSILRVQCFEMETTALLQQVGMVPVWAATLEGKDIRELEVPDEAVIVIGNESRGISDALRAEVDQEIMIPRFGKAESLNAAMATGVLLGWLRL